MPLPRAESVAAARDQIRRDHGECPVFTLAFFNDSNWLEQSEREAEAWLKRLTVVAKTPAGLVFPEGLTALLVEERGRLVGILTSGLKRQDGLLLILGGRLTDALQDEIIRKALDHGLYEDAEGADAALERARAAGLFDQAPADPVDLLPPWMEMTIGISIVLGIITAILYAIWWWSTI